MANRGHSKRTETQKVVSDFFMKSWCMLSLLIIYVLSIRIHAANAETTLSTSSNNSVSGTVSWTPTPIEYNAKPGDTNAVFSIGVTNNSATQVLIKSVRSSCGCTIARLPADPWPLEPKGKGEITVTVDLRGKCGTLNKLLVIDTSVGFKFFTMKINIPLPEKAADARAREQNLLAAMGDRQAIFKGDCARCHVTPGRGKQGKALYDAMCGICHDVPSRATMVPDLKKSKQTTNRTYWHTWTAKGKSGTLMPAFTQDEGGPLTGDEVNSIVDYILNDYFKSQSNAAKP